MDPDRCMWLDKDENIEIPCDDSEALFSQYVLISIKEYTDFRENYECRLKRQRDASSINIGAAEGFAP